MTEGDFFAMRRTGLSVGDDMIIRPKDAATNAVEVHSLMHMDQAYVYHREDSTFTGSYEISIQIERLDGNGISQQNKIELCYNPDKNLNQTLRVYSTGSTADFAATGVEISD